ncbi:MAG: NusG domain II-containing protein [Clostridia bacterium]|nr:NusG domain II-containing protein [Clostridia bacterium]
MKKGDIAVILSVLAVTAAAFCIIRFTGVRGTTVKISQNNTTLYELSLFEDKKIALSGNTVEIKNGAVSVISADCKNQICVNHKAISKKGESIACLPNKVIVEIE